MNQFEKTIVGQMQLASKTFIGGIDEVGRGAWAGPIVVAGVILPVNYLNLKIQDSKQLSAAQRQRLFCEITKHALSIEVIFISARLVDCYGPRRASVRGMTKIIQHWSLHKQVNLVLTDAEPVAAEVPVMAVIKGDQRSQSIAAASIIAKVMRDQHMQLIDLWWPLFGFGAHKGYGTQQHRASLTRHGRCWLHRHSYRPIRALNQRQLAI